LGIGNRSPLPKMNQATTLTGRAPAAGTAEAARQALAQAAQGWPAAPAGLGDSAPVAALWRAVMVARLPSQWHPIDLEHAANLVRCLRDIADQDAAVQREGLMVGKGARQHVNPRHAVIDTLNRRAAMLTRLLQLHAVPTARAADKAGAKSEAAGASQTLAGIPQQPAAGVFNPDDLLARPRLQ